MATNDKKEDGIGADPEPVVEAESKISNLHISNSKEEEVVPLDPQLLTLLNNAKVGDARTLQKMATAVKKFLFESYQKNEKRRSVYRLLENDEFMQPLLMKCLKTNVAKMPGLVSDSLWILNAILDLHDDVISPQVDALVEAGIVSLMAKLVTVQDNSHGVNERAAGTLELLAFCGYRDELLDAGMGLLSSLTKLAKKKTRYPKLDKIIVHVVGTLMGHVRVAPQALTTQRIKTLADYQEMIEFLPPLALVRESIPLLSLLLNTKDDEVLGKVLSCLAFGGCVQGSFEYIVNSGILKKVMPYFNHSDGIVQFFAITSISSIASIDEKKALEFIKSVKGTMGLKEFYRGLISPNDALVWAADQFFSCAVSAITGECNAAALNAVLSSGFIHTLVQCLKVDMSEKHVLGAAWALGRISSDIPSSQRRLVVEAGALPFLVAQLKNPNEIITSMTAVTIGNLVQDKPINRDKVLELNVVPSLLALLKKEGCSLQALVSILAALEMIADVRPNATPEALKDVPSALIAILDNKTINFPDKLIPGIYSIVGKLCDSGSEGINCVIQGGFLPRLQSALSNGNVDTLAFALEAVEAISRGTKEQRDAIVEIGIVENLVGLLQHQVKYIRGVSLCSLSNLYKGQLTAERRQWIQKMVPQVLVEMAKQDPRTQHPAGFAFQNVMSYFKKK